MMPYCVGNKGGGSPVVSAQENKASVLCICGPFIGGQFSWLE
jgi:hypothetical protein